MHYYAEDGCIMLSMTTLIFEDPMGKNGGYDG